MAVGVVPCAKRSTYGASLVLVLLAAICYLARRDACYILHPIDVRRTL